VKKSGKSKSLHVCSNSPLLPTASSDPPPPMRISRFILSPMKVCQVRHNDTNTHTLSRERKLKVFVCQ